MSDQPDKHSTDTDDTKQAPRSEDPETAVVASDTTTVNGNELAWSLDDTDELEPARHGRIVVWAGLVTLLAGIVAAVILLGATFFGWLPSKHAEPPAVPTPTASVPVATPPPAPVAAPAPAPAPTVTVTAQPPAPPTQVTTTMPPLAFTATQDQRLLNDLGSMGYAIPNPALVVYQAHQYCLLVRQGEDSSQVNQDIQAATGWDASYTLQVTSGAILAYPNCRGYPLAR